MKNKILKFEHLREKISELKKDNKKIVHCHGVFDVVHIGHIKHFIEAKRNGNILIITVTSDKFVNKSSNRPIFKQNKRMEFLAQLECVDFVSLSNSKSSIEMLNIIKPDFYVKGQDYKDLKGDTTGKIILEKKIVEKNGGKIIFTNEETFSSSNIINNNFAYNEEQKKYLNQISKKYSFKLIHNIFKKISNLKVLVIGETIIDQYNFCEALGKSGKEPYMAFKDLYTENYLGGAAAIANHISGFVKQVKLLSMLGDDKKYEKFVKKNLKPNVKSEFLIRKKSPTISKKRFLDNISNNKLFGVYSLNDQIIPEQEEKKIKNLIKKNINKYDLIIISDYGHGFLSEKNAKMISKTKKYLALNAQVNAANIGYHTMTKYNNIDAMIINETELRHEMRDKNEKIDNLSKKLLHLINIKDLVVTRGTNGAILSTKNSKNKYSCPAFANKLLDKVGAGDTMLALLSLMLKAGCPKDLSLLIGSFAGAFSVEIMGNSKFLDKNKILRSIEFSLK